MEDSLKSLDAEADRIIQETLEKGPNIPVDPASTRARIEAVYAQLPTEARDVNVLGRLALLSGVSLPPRATPAEAKVDKLVQLIPLKVADERNRVDLKPRTLELPADFDEKGGEISINGERVKLPRDYFLGMQDLGLVDVIEAMGLDDKTKERLLEKILPKIEKDENGVTFTTPSGNPMFRFGPDGFVDLKKSQFGVSNESLFAALYSARRTSVLTPDEKSEIEKQIISFETQKTERSSTTVIMNLLPNGTKFRFESSSKGLEEMPKGYWNYDRPRGLINPLISEEFLRFDPNCGIHRDGEMRKKDDGTLAFSDGRRREDFVTTSSDGKNVKMKTGPYVGSIKYLHAAIQILKRPGHIYGVDDFGPRERFRESLLNGILNSIVVDVVTPT